MGPLTQEQIWGEPVAERVEQEVLRGFCDEDETEAIKKSALELINRPEGLIKDDEQFLIFIAALERRVTVAERERFLSIE